MRSGTSGTFPVDGVADRPVSTIELGGLAAVTSRLTDERLRVRRRDLVRHLHVLESVFAETTIVPCAFGTVLRSQEAVESELLEARREELHALLERLEGRLQLNVKAVYDEETVLREIVESEPEIARLRRQSRALGMRGTSRASASASSSQRRSASAGPPTPSACSTVCPPTPTTWSSTRRPRTSVLKASFLVSRERSGPFDAALDSLAAAEAPRLSFESIGPLPPTAFVSLEAVG